MAKFGFGASGSGGNIGGGGKKVGAKTITQSLIAGNNTATHSIGASFTVNDVTVLNASNQKVSIDWDIIDVNSIRVILAGGSVANAVINILYA